MFAWFKRRTVEDVLNETKLVKVMGVIFEIKRLDAASYFDGSRSLLQMYQTYEDKRLVQDIDIDKVKKHYIDVFMNSVVSPKLSRKQGEPDTLFVDNILKNWNLANMLYEEIILYTYGKKKSYPRRSASLS